MMMKNTQMKENTKIMISKTGTNEVTKDMTEKVTKMREGMAVHIKKHHDKIKCIMIIHVLPYHCM